MTSLRIATRQSPLALWQAQFVAGRLRALHPELAIELLGMTTAGDRFQAGTLAGVGGKGLFVKELEQALLEDRADIAVHSMKDVPVELPDGLDIPVIMAREDVRDVLIAGPDRTLRTLPAGSRVGTASLRRRSQLLVLRPDLKYADLRGNVGTRLQKLRDGRFHAIILAAAGLKRLGLEAEITEYFAVEDMLPAIGQGALGIECRIGDQRVRELIRALDDDDTHRCVTAERAINACLGGGCQFPIAGHAWISGPDLELRGVIGDIEQGRLISAALRAPVAAPESAGLALGRQLLERGGAAILAKLNFGHTGMIE